MIAEFHAKALAEIAGVKIVAAYNRSPTKGSDFAAKHGMIFAETLEALLANPEVDIVCLCTPSGDRLAPSLACASFDATSRKEHRLPIRLAVVNPVIRICGSG